MLFRKYLYKIGIYPLRMYWFLFRPRTYGAKCVLMQRDGKILFVRTTYEGRSWSLPGGGIHKDESAIDAARREVREEVGIVTDSLSQIGEFENKHEYKRDYVTVFLGTVENDAVIRIDQAEIEEARWFLLDDIIGEVSANTRIALSFLSAT